jgi:hypothetical protein
MPRNFSNGVDRIWSGEGITPLYKSSNLRQNTVATFVESCWEIIEPISKK